MQVKEGIPGVDEGLDSAGASTAGGTLAERLDTCMKDTGSQRTKVFLFIGVYYRYIPIYAFLNHSAQAHINPQISP